MWGIMHFPHAGTHPLGAMLPKGSMSSLPLVSSAVSDTMTLLHTTSVTTAISPPVITEVAVEPVTGTSNAPLCNLLPGSGTVKRVSRNLRGGGTPSSAGQTGREDR